MIPEFKIKASQENAELFSYGNDCKQMKIKVWVSK